MKTVEECRARLLSALELALERPGLYVGSDQCADQFFCKLLNDLSWIDEREDDYRALFHSILKGARLVVGQFYFQNFRFPGMACNEIASTYAEAAYQLGYFNPNHILDHRAFEDLQETLDQTFFKNDHIETEMIAALGPPSLSVVGGITTVCSYASIDKSTPWIHFDFARCYAPPPGAFCDWFDSPLLRDIRRHENRLELLPFGKHYFDLDCPPDQE
jgi:hypothetical protein